MDEFHAEQFLSNDVELLSDVNDILSWNLSTGKVP